jgi:methylmalonyl-CoA/ethylmalonyl-CoA epimerase
VDHDLRPAATARPARRRPHTPHGDFLDAHGEGVFHIGFSVDSVDEAEAAAATLGLDVILRRRRGDASGFSYFDTYPSAGVTLQVRRAPTA